MIGITSQTSTLDRPARRPASLVREEQGMAVIIALVALLILSAIGLYMNINASTELRISDNYESDVRARYAAIAGINHARAVIRGLNFDGLLQGPDGMYTITPQTRTMAFRNFVDWATARAMDIQDPSAYINPLPDDGLVNTGKEGAIPGTVVIPKIGVELPKGGVQIPNTANAIFTARYFVKVTNNIEASDLAKDPSDNPFIDGDGIIIVRSMGIAQTFRDTGGATVRRNSVVVFEARFQKNSPFNTLNSPLLIIGNDVNVVLNGKAFDIVGSPTGYGVATIDTNTADDKHPDAIFRAFNDNKGTIKGSCTGDLATNCVGDITAEISADPKRAMMKDPNWLYDLVFNQLPPIADNTWDGSSWNSGFSNDMGTVSNPKITYINGDKKFDGNMSGVGVLVCTGGLDLGGAFIWDGLVIVVGTGDFWPHGLNKGINGGVIVANLTKSGGVPTFGTPTFRTSGNSDITHYDSGFISMGAGLISLKQLTFREVNSAIDR